MAFKERIFRRHRADGAVQTGDEPPAQAASDPSQPDATPQPDVRRRRRPGRDGAARSRRGRRAGPGRRPDRRDAGRRERRAAARAACRAGPASAQRGRMRRRLRYLREVRELGFRDLGGLVFDQHRFGRPNEALVQGKVSAIDATDRETRALEAALDERKPYSELFVAGVSACQRCGGLHGSDARFCPSCGLAFGGPRTLAGVGAEQPRASRRAGRPRRSSPRTVRRRPRRSSPRTRAGAARAARAGRTRRRGPRSARGPGSVSAVAGGDPAYAAPPEGSLPCGRCGELLAARPGLVPSLRRSCAHGDRADAALAPPTARARRLRAARARRAHRGLHLAHRRRSAAGADGHEHDHDATR